ncbi:MAG: DUF1203 domain-containing protein [Gemmobacter sp.]|uniref:DUF1203 domain-containing protein n=1 Tax=Gemmobacter sp. TaxID=1898957 RepID=UPI001A466C4E|nr:DUF1203 domain-containing protein [Gemmobacter sp.]MBL8563701.1 DUF1203 domain-containing protein [Gemmobacter sp.]
MAVRFVAMETAQVRALQGGAPDANGMPPERHRATGAGNPCRHCLDLIPEGAGMLILAHRPFPSLHPYAECGPIFLCAAPCTRGGGASLPALLTSPDYILRGYGADDRIIYGSGAVLPTHALIAEAEARFANPAIRYLHIRSARNNCFQCRVERA